MGEIKKSISNEQLTMNKKDSEQLWRLSSKFNFN
jgi:hypothetical protein